MRNTLQNFAKLLLITIATLFIFFSSPISKSSPISDVDKVAKYDVFGRLTYYPNKKQIDCPPQTKNTGVLLIIGQSNSANHAHKIFTTQHPGHVINYFNGHCFVASSPLLGATGPNGEYITPLADNLIANGTFKDVVIVASGISGSPISRWKLGGDLNGMLRATLIEARSKYEVTDIVWHQGENDFRDGTSAKDYAASFQSLLSSLTSMNVAAPTFMSIASKCLGVDWRENNPTAIGQKMLIDNKRIFLGVDTDSLLVSKDRHDGCHFSEDGQKKTADALAVSIKQKRGHYQR